MVNFIHFLRQRISYFTVLLRRLIVAKSVKTMAMSVLASARKLSSSERTNCAKDSFDMS